MKKTFYIIISLILFNFNLISQNNEFNNIYDNEKIFTSEEIDSLNSIISEYESKYKLNYTIITTDTISYDNSYNLKNNIFIIISRNNREFVILTNEFSKDQISFFTDSVFEKLENEEYFNSLINFINIIASNYTNHNIIKYTEIVKNIFLITIFAIILLMISFFISNYYKKNKNQIELKKQINTTKNDIVNLKRKLKKLPSDLDEISRDEKLNTTIIDIQTLNNLKNIYNSLANYKQIVNTIDNYFEKIENSRKDIEKYIENNYPYCKDYLKSEIDDMLKMSNVEDLKEKEYTKEVVYKLSSIESTIENKLKTFLNKVVKIKNIIDDKKNINNTIQKLKNSHDIYNNKINILKGAKIGKRLESLVKIEFDKYYFEIEKDIINSFNYLEKNDINNALISYGKYITNLSVLNNFYNSVNILYDRFIKSQNYIKSEKDKMIKLSLEIDSNINKNNVVYTRKELYEKIKKDIDLFNKEINNDIIFASEILSKILNNLIDLNEKIINDIVDKKMKNEKRR